MVEIGQGAIGGSEKLDELSAAGLCAPEARCGASQSARFVLCLSLLLVAAVAIGVYSNSFNHSFVYDDKATIVENRFIRDFRNLSKFFSRDYFSQASELTYRPVVTFSYMVDFRLWGQRPKGFHATNISLHMINSMLIFFIAISLWRSRAVGLVCGTIFASYPVMSEAVNAISFREDQLAAAFFFFALLAHLALSGEPGALKKKFRANCRWHSPGRLLICSLFSQRRWLLASPS